MSKLIRISESTFKKLIQLERESGDSTQTIIDNALERLIRDNLLNKGNEIFEKLERNPEVWEYELELPVQTDTDGSVDLH